MRPAIKAIIFDMDGTLVDSEPLHLAATQAMLAEYDVTYTEEDNRQFLGRKDLDCAIGLVKNYNLPLTPEQVLGRKEDILSRYLKEKAKPRPGVHKLLDSAKNHSLPMAVASSATLPTIELVISLLNLRSFFHNLTSGDEVEHGKPAPDVFVLAASRLDTPVQNCLVIEDTLNGVKAAKAAGMQCIAVPCDATRHQDLSLADVVMESLEDIVLPDWIQPGNISFSRRD